MPAVCSLCAQRKKQMIPVTWCPDCEEALCESCGEHHSLSQSSKEHTTIPFKDFEQLPSIIVSTSSKCVDHQERLTDFCRFHDKAICKSCIKASHKKCSDIPTINEIVQNVKTSVLFEDVMSEVEHMNKLLSKIVENRKANIKEIDVMRQTMHRRLEHEFDKIVKRLKQAKQNTASEIDQVIDQQRDIISDVLPTVVSKATLFTDILSQEENIKQFSSNFQCFIGLKKIEELIFDSQKYLKKLLNDNTLDTIDISIEVNETFREIVGSMQSFGEIKVGTIPPSVLIDIGKEREAQKKVHRTTNIKLQQKIQLNRNGNYNGCCTLLNGIMVFPNSVSHQVTIHNSNGSHMSTIQFTDKEEVHDVSAVDDNHFAVSNPKSETISVIDSKNGNIVKTVKARNQPHGICHDNGNIFFCMPRKGIMRVSVDSESLNNIVCDEEVTWRSHISVGNDRVCYTCPDIHTVTVLDNQYNLIFKFNDKSLLSTPVGVTMDADKNLYLTCRGSDTLLVLASNGKSCHQLLCKKDGLSSPYGVYFDSITKHLLIVNLYGPAFQYAVG